MSFDKFNQAVNKQFKKMQAGKLYTLDVSKDELWDTYINAFPAGTNPVFKERTEHDCNCCKSFVRNAGKIVSIVNGKVETIWDCEVEDFYQVVAQKMKDMLSTKVIDNVLYITESKLGTGKNAGEGPNGPQFYYHFELPIPSEYVARNKDLIGPKLSDIRSGKDVFLRALKEITTDSIDMVLELIDQNSIYRGSEHKFLVTEFQKIKKKFDKVRKNKVDQDIFAWENVTAVSSQAITRIRSTVIGSLLVDLSEGVDLETAVKSFESKVAPTNYKRTKSLVTKKMTDDAQKTINELGYMSALQRRYAHLGDITINNVLFADRSTKQAMNVFDEIGASATVKSQSFDKVEEVSIDKFISDILPRAEKLEVLVENSHTNNFVSLIAPVDPESKNMFKWNNNFSWSYTGDFTDSIKERVKRAGGRVDGYLRASLSWYNYDDLDLHMNEPKPGEHIDFGHKRSSKTGGHLDVDMNAGSGQTRTPVENIIYTNNNTMIEGEYMLFVNQFHARESDNFGFEVELELNGTVHNIVYNKRVGDKVNVPVAKIHYSKKNGLKLVDSLPSTKTSKKVWNVNTETFVKVNAVTFSPNFWDEKSVGNKHFFFLLDGCQNEGQARGFYNEFLSPELDKHRKVLEIVGSKMKTEESENQLSGIGFSSTQRNSLICRVYGKVVRTIKIVF